MAKGSLHKAKLLLILLTLLCGMKELRANTYIEFESRYEGDGWFKYTIRLPPDYFGSAFEINSLIVSFGSAQEVEVPQGWSAPFIHEAIWNSLSTLARPSEHIFRCRSSYRHFRFSPLSLRVVVTIPDPETGMPMQASGLIYGLVPCPPEEADGSEPVFTAKSKTNPDLKITNLYHASGKVTDISLNLNTTATCVLEASSDLVEWHDVTTFEAPEGTASFTSLTDSGPFFRVRVGGNYVPSVSLSSAVSKTATGKTLKETSLTIRDGELVVSFPSQPDKPYTVEFLSFSGQLLKKMAVTGTALKTTVSAPADLSSDPFLLRVYATQSSTK